MLSGREYRHAPAKHLEPRPPAPGGDRGVMVPPAAPLLFPEAEGILV